MKDIYFVKYDTSIITKIYFISKTIGSKQTLMIPAVD